MGLTPAERAYLNQAKGHLAKARKLLEELQNHAFSDEAKEAADKASASIGFAEDDIATMIRKGE